MKNAHDPQPLRHAPARSPRRAAGQRRRRGRRRRRARGRGGAAGNRKAAGKGKERRARSPADGGGRRSAGHGAPADGPEPAPRLSKSPSRARGGRRGTDERNREMEKKKRDPPGGGCPGSGGRGVSLGGRRDPRRHPRTMPRAVAGSARLGSARLGSARLGSARLNACSNPHHVMRTKPSARLEPRHCRLHDPRRLPRVFRWNRQAPLRRRMYATIQDSFMALSNILC